MTLGGSRSLGQDERRSTGGVTLRLSPCTDVFSTNDQQATDLITDRVASVSYV